MLKENNDMRSPLYKIIILLYLASLLSGCSGVISSTTPTKEFEETSRAIRSLIETLERNPQELIFGKDRNAKGE